MAGLFPPALLAQIRNASDIVEIIGGYVPLKRLGSRFTALCPFHKEKSPSFHVNPQRQMFYCFGCHKGGDVFRFIQDYENIPFYESVKRLAERARIPLETTGHIDPKTVAVKDTLLQIHEQITQRWHAMLMNDAGGEPGRSYLATRNLSEAAIKLFRLGYAPDGWDDTVNWAKSKGHDLKLVEQAGLIVHKEDSDHYYDRFRGRLIFPICDDQGRVVAFSGRVLDAASSPAKYVNSPETPIFVKSRIFFGLDKSKRALLDRHSALICEGQLDLIRCFTSGIENVVAPQGTALTADHCRILKRYVDEAVLCFDSDNAGQNATVRSMENLFAAGLTVRVVRIPPPHDPDSMIRENGAEAMRALVDNAPSFFDYYLNRLRELHDPSSDRGKISIVREMATVLKMANNNLLTDKYCQKTAAQLQVSVESVRTEMKKLARTAYAAPEAKEEAVPEIVDSPKRSIHESWLLKLILLDDHLIPWLADHLNPVWIRDPGIQTLLSQIIALHRDDNWTGVTGLLDHVEDESLRRLVLESVADPRPIPNAEKVVQGDPLKKGAVETLRNEYLDREMEILRQRFSSSEISEEERTQLHHRVIALREAKKQPIRPLADE